MLQKTHILVGAALLLTFLGCQPYNKQSLESQITKFENQVESESKSQTLSSLYQQFYAAKPTDTANARQLTFVANQYLKASNMDSAAYFFQIVYSKFAQHHKAAYAMLNYAALQKNVDDQLHWYRQTNKLYPTTKEGEQALLTVGITYENLQKPEEAMIAYQEYLVMYPNSALIPDVQLSIKNIHKSPEELVKEFEAQNKKVQ